MSILPFGGNSVMAGRALEQLNEHDYFPSHPWAFRAGRELIRMLDPRAWSFWEGACGEGHGTFGLKDGASSVFSTDIVDYGSDLQDGVVDFLQPEADQAAVRHFGEQPDWIVTNPPFVDGEAFIRAAWARAQRGVAMLARLQFTEGGGRYSMFTHDCPLAMAATFSERVPMFVGRWDPERSCTTAYRWFFFLKPEAIEQSPLGGAIDVARAHGCSLERLIPPGTRARLERHEDLVRFGPLSVKACLSMALQLDALGDAKSVKKAAELRDDARRIQGLIEASGDPLFSAGGMG